MVIELGNTKYDVLRSDAKQRLARDYPYLYMDEFLLVDNRSCRFAIDDVSYRARNPVEEYIEFLFVACKGDVQVFEASKLTTALTKRIERLLTVVIPQRTVVLFPGEGAQTVRKLLPEALLEGITVVSVPTQRKVDARTKTVDGVTISDVTQIRKQLSDMKINTIIVLDDVIATGETLSTLREAFPGRNVDWYAGAFFARSPLQNRGRAVSPSGIEGFKSVLTPIVYQGINGIPGLNSLSTLTGSSDKSKSVRKRYMDDYVTDPDIFLEMVQQLQQSVVSSR